MIEAILKELQLRKHEYSDKDVETIYFGGGTPSLLTNDELQLIIDAVYHHYHVIDDSEITLEANPDDLSVVRIKELAQSPINRLSIGIQSFFDQDLELMNRAHNSDEARVCLEEASKHFKNITIDLIYGIPGMSRDRWLQSINEALSYNIPHISSYALTVEPKTALASFIKKGIVDNVNDEEAQEHFHMLIDRLEDAGFVHYEISNFGKEGYFSKNNSAYWQGKSYIGIGPSAHSFDGNNRGWNVRNNTKYIKSINDEILPMEIEHLSVSDKYNEYVMTGLRTIWGVSLDKVELDFGKSYKDYVLLQAQPFINEHLLYIDDDKLLVTKKGKFLSDGIASDLFKLNLE